MKTTTTMNAVKTAKIKQELAKLIQDNNVPTAYLDDLVSNVLLVWGDETKNPNFPEPLERFDLEKLTGEQAYDVYDAVAFEYVDKPRLFAHKAVETPKAPKAVEASSQWDKIKQNATRSIPADLDQSVKDHLLGYINYVLSDVKEDEDEVEIKTLLTKGQKRLLEVLQDADMTKRWHCQATAYAKKWGCQSTPEQHNRFLYGAVRTTFFGATAPIFGLRYVDHKAYSRVSYYASNERQGSRHGNIRD